MKLPHMKLVLATLVGAVCVIAGSAVDTANADPYKWCAMYGGGRGSGGKNCYFLTLAQCNAAVSGVGGFCTPNQFYDGRPEGSGPPIARPKKNS